MIFAYKRTKTSAPTCNTKMQTNAFCKISLFNMQRQTKRLCRAIGKGILYSKTHFVNHDNRYVLHNNLHNSGSLIKDFTDELRFSGIPFFVKVMYSFRVQMFFHSTTQWLNACIKFYWQGFIKNQTLQYVCFSL